MGQVACTFFLASSDESGLRALLSIMETLPHAHLVWTSCCAVTPPPPPPCYWFARLPQKRQLWPPCIGRIRRNISDGLCPRGFCCDLADCQPPIRQQALCCGLMRNRHNWHQSSVQPGALVVQVYFLRARQPCLRYRWFGAIPVSKTEGGHGGRLFTPPKYCCASFSLGGAPSFCNRS